MAKIILTNRGQLAIAIAAALSAAVTTTIEPGQDLALDIEPGETITAIATGETILGIENSSEEVFAYDVAGETAHLQPGESEDIDLDEFDEITIGLAALQDNEQEEEETED